MSIREALHLSADLPRLDREVLLSHALGKERVYLMAHSEEVVSPTKLKRYRSYLARATKHEPIAYIIGQKEFYGRNFSVAPGVLIPRPETELLVEQVLSRIKNQELGIRNKRKQIAIIDVGTGSGAIITSIFLSLQINHRKNISWFAVDSEETALYYARKNAKHLCTSTKIRFLKSNLLSRVAKTLSSYDEVFVVANLPYLSETLYRSTAPNVKDYEPKSALVSGVDGLDHYRQLIAQLLALRKSGTRIHFFLEISPEQAPKLTRILAGIDALSTLEIIPDLAGKPRAVVGTLFVP